MRKKKRPDVKGIVTPKGKEKKVIPPKAQEGLSPKSIKKWKNSLPKLS